MIKKFGFVMLLFMLPFGIQAQELELFYQGEFETQGPPLSIAADANGGIYYTVFTFAGANQTRCFYVEDPIANAGTENHVLVSDAADTEVPAGRGFTGVAVDSQGNVYLALESGSNDSANVRKLSPAPEFAEVDEFASGVVFAGIRYNGVEVLTDDVIALTTFSSVEFWDANNSAPLHTIGGTEAFQRDLAYNPNNDDIYISKNGNESTNSVTLLTGGTPDDPTTYAAEAGFIAQGGVDSAFGVNAQQIEYDSENNVIAVPDYSAEQTTVAFYNPNNTEEALVKVDASESPNAPFASPSDIVAVPTETETLYFITDNGNGRVVIYTDNPETSVSNWNIY